YRSTCSSPPNTSCQCFMASAIVPGRAIYGASDEVMGSPSAGRDTESTVSSTNLEHLGQISSQLTPSSVAPLRKNARPFRLETTVIPPSSKLSYFHPAYFAGIFSICQPP